ncbi:conserved exported protein of unknown function [Nitrospina watsonii]|uniref:Uncharacterized protein n=1 Tax=Nitrospina watsonii TaxID=1323948 RepID=A0ABM9HF50_9BACT|nr:conserved exported protein of unknown function [Nitrospina watsonii]
MAVKRFIFTTFLLAGCIAVPALAAADTGHTHHGGNPFDLESGTSAHCELNGHQHAHANQRCPHKKPYRSPRTELGLDCGGQTQGTVPAQSTPILKTFGPSRDAVRLASLIPGAYHPEAPSLFVLWETSPPSPPPKSF